MSITTGTHSLVEKLKALEPLSVTGAYVGQEVPTPGGPDIIYHFDEAKLKERTARRLQEDVRPSPIRLFRIVTDWFNVAFPSCYASSRWFPCQARVTFGMGGQGFLQGRRGMDSCSER